jgi:hypothetical protein
VKGAEVYSPLSAAAPLMARDSLKTESLQMAPHFLLDVKTSALAGKRTHVLAVYLPHV